MKETQDTDPKRVYCENGICQYLLSEEAGFASLSGMCSECLIKSLEAEDANI